MNRNEQLQKIIEFKTQTWDVVVIGGGATGLGVALDATTRGYKTLLLEQADFAKGTSSRSTKLVHGGVRYLAQGNIRLVKEALRERGLLRKNAPHLVKEQLFLIPAYHWWEKPFYGIGMKVYDALAGKLGLMPSRFISSQTAKKLLPNLQFKSLQGGISYSDGQFDDARLALNIAQTVVEKGGVLLNYASVIQFLKDQQGKINGLIFKDLESNLEHIIQAKIIINATGVFAEKILRLDNPDTDTSLKPSQGIHLVIDRKFLPGDSALMIPKTADGRVLFAVPWHDKIVVGTTDTPVAEVSDEPQALKSEIEFILNTLKTYLIESPSPEDVLSVYVGLRPLVASKSQKTKDISRDHKIMLSDSGLLTIIGGKWTTFRKMGQDAIDRAIKSLGLPSKKCQTENLKIHGYSTDNQGFENIYGSDMQGIQNLITQNVDWGKPLHSNLPINPAQIIWAVRFEMARQIEDVLARRTRCLLLNAQATIEIAPQVAEIMAKELEKSKDWTNEQIEKFTQLAQKYLLKNYI
jgi:glycerol-3-phosphate dehydrogenase